MRKDEFERRGAEMRARHAAANADEGTPTASPVDVVADSCGVTKRTTDNETSPANAKLTIAELPIAPPYSLLGNLWKRHHTQALLIALGAVQPAVLRAAKAVGSQQVKFDGLGHLHGKGVLNIAASTAAMPEALRLCDLFMRTVDQQGGSVSVTETTDVTIENETIEVQIREGSERRTKRVRQNGDVEREYSPTQQIWIMVVGEFGGQLKTLVRDQSDIDSFLRKVRRRAEGLPEMRRRKSEKEQAQAEKLQLLRMRLHNEAEQQRQRTEQQQSFDRVFADVEKWTKAERVRAYATAFEAQHLSTSGKVEPGSHLDGWLRWLHWYAHHLDPLTRPEGPSIGPTT